MAVALVMYCKDTLLQHLLKALYDLVLSYDNLMAFSCIDASE